MDTPFPRTPAALPPGAGVGPWVVVSWRDQGSYGVVYRVRRAGHPEAGDFALKMALSLNEPRFEREVELLRRVQHPHMPQLHDRGWWTLPDGTLYLYEEYFELHHPELAKILGKSESITALAPYGIP